MKFTIINYKKIKSNCKLQMYYNIHENRITKKLEKTKIRNNPRRKGRVYND